MTDRLEELLALMDDEDEEEQREGGSTLTEGAPPVGAPLEKRPEERAAGEDAPADGSAPEQDAREAQNGAEPASAQEQVWPILDGDGPGAAAARRQPEGPGDAPPEEGNAPREDRDGERGAEMARVIRRGDESGLDGLYRRAVQASRPAAPQVLPPEQAGRPFRAEEPGRTAALTVEELDRAVRRDSRRYDGGMTLF